MNTKHAQCTCYTFVRSVLLLQAAHKTASVVLKDVICLGTTRYQLNHAEDLVAVSPSMTNVCITAMCQQFVKSLPAMSLGEMVGQGEVVSSSNLVHPKGENGMAMHGLGCERPMGEPFFSCFKCKWT